MKSERSLPSSKFSLSNKDCVAAFQGPEEYPSCFAEVSSEFDILLTVIFFDSGRKA